MKILDIFKKRPPEWNQLTDSKRNHITSLLSKTIKNMAGARYKIVSGSDQLQREQGVIEKKGEDDILDQIKRGKLLDLTRNAVRNNSMFNTILKQFDLQGVGTVGGKVIINLEDDKYSKDVKKEFSKWTRNADFFDGLNLNTILKLVLKTEIIGGDLVILFDDNLINDSGRILIYEPDEIGDTDEKEVKKRYGDKSFQKQGRVYTQYGQFQGVIVSRSQRGEKIFDSKQCYFLKKDPNGSIFDDKWLMPRNIFRVKQGRGITPMSSSLSTIIDLNDYIGFELAAAKKNSQTLGMITNDKIVEKVNMPTAFDSDTDFSDMTDEEIEQVAKDVEDTTDETTVSLDQIKAAGVIYQQLPDGYKLDLLDTKHPNPNSIEFVKWLSVMSGGPLGLSSVYSTLKVDSSYTAFRGEQLMSQPTFEESQKFLENICDWIFFRWSNWAIRKGIIENKFNENWIQNISWEWPQLRDVDRVKEQNAIALQLKNNTGSYREVFGSNWRDELRQIAEEKKFMKELGLVHPSDVTVSGAVIEQNDEKNLDN